MVVRNCILGIGTIFYQLLIKLGLVSITGIGGSYRGGKGSLFSWFIAF
jgi:hypothetical protein